MLDRNDDQRMSHDIQFSSGVRFLWEKDDQQQCAPVTREHMSLSGSNSTHWDVVRVFASYTAQTAEMMQFGSSSRRRGAIGTHTHTKSCIITLDVCSIGPFLQKVMLSKGRPLLRSSLNCNSESRSINMHQETERKFMLINYIC